MADAHAKDLEAQDKQGVNYINYGFNEEKGEVFCLIEDAVRKGGGSATRPFGCPGARAG